MTDEEQRRLNDPAQSYLDWYAEVFSRKAAPKPEKKAPGRRQYELCWNGKVQSWRDTERQEAEGKGIEVYVQSESERETK